MLDWVLQNLQNVFRDCWKTQGWAAYPTWMLLHTQRSPVPRRWQSPLAREGPGSAWEVVCPMITMPSSWSIIPLGGGTSCYSHIFRPSLYVTHLTYEKKNMFSYVFFVWKFWTITTPNRARLPALVRQPLLQGQAFRSHLSRCWDAPLTARGLGGMPSCEKLSLKTLSLRFKQIILLIWISMVTWGSFYYINPNFMHFYKGNVSKYTLNVSKYTLASSLVPSEIGLILWPRETWMPETFEKFVPSGELT